MFAWSTNNDSERKTLSQFAADKIRQKWSRVKKIQFILILGISTGILCFQVIECVKKYNLRSTATADKYVHVSNASFPVMTICPTYPYKLDRLNYHGVATRSDIQFQADFVSNRSDYNPIQFYEDVILKKEEIIDVIEIFSEQEFDGKNNFVLGPNDIFCEESLFKTKEYY